VQRLTWDKLAGLASEITAVFLKGFAIWRNPTKRQKSKSKSYLGPHTAWPPRLPWIYAYTPPRSPAAGKNLGELMAEGKRCLAAGDASEAVENFQEACALMYASLCLFILQTIQVKLFWCSGLKSMVSWRGSWLNRITSMARLCWSCLGMWFYHGMCTGSTLKTMSASTHSLVLVSNQLHCWQLLSTSFSQLNINNTNDKQVGLRTRLCLLQVCSKVEAIKRVVKNGMLHCGGPHG